MTRHNTIVVMLSLAYSIPAAKSFLQIAKQLLQLLSNPQNTHSSNGEGSIMDWNLTCIFMTKKLRIYVT